MVVWVKTSCTRGYPSTCISEGHVAVYSSESTYHVSGLCCRKFLRNIGTHIPGHTVPKALYDLHKRDRFKRCSQLRILIF